MRIIMNTGVNISIITLPVVKKLWMTIEMSDESKIIAIDQIKKNVISIVKDAFLSIQNARVLVSLLVIDALEDNLFLKTDWINWYQANLSFYKKELKFWCQG